MTIRNAPVAKRRLPKKSGAKHAFSGTINGLFAWFRPAMHDPGQVARYDPGQAARPRPKRQEMQAKIGRALRQADPNKEPGREAADHQSHQHVSNQTQPLLDQINSAAQGSKSH